MWKNPIFICTYFRPFSHWNSDESNGHGHILYYSPLLRGRFSGLLHDMQVYYAAQIMGASLHTSSTNLLHTPTYGKHRQLMGLRHSPFFHQLTCLSADALNHARWSHIFQYADDIYHYNVIMQYAFLQKVDYSVTTNYTHLTQDSHAQWNIDMTPHANRNYRSNKRHSPITAHLRQRALPFDRGPPWSRSTPRGLKKRHSTCLFSMTPSKGILPFDRGPERPRSHPVLDFVYTDQHVKQVYPPQRTLPFDRGPTGPRSVYGERNSRHTPCLSSRSQTRKHMKHTDSCLHTLTGVHLRRRALPFDRGPKRHDTASGEIPLEKILQQSTGVHLQQKALPFDRGPERPRPTNGELLHQYM